MKNNFRKKKLKKTSLFSIIENFLKKTSISEGLPLKYWKNIIFIFILGVVYIANAHYHHKIFRKLNKLEHEVSDLKVSYIILQANCLDQLREAEIYKKAVNIGLIRSKNPPYIIK